MLIVYQAFNCSLFVLSPIRYKISAKKLPSKMKLKETKRWHLLYYMQNCRRVQQVLGAYSVINNYLLEYFKIECGYLLITTFIQ